MSEMLEAIEEDLKRSASLFDSDHYTDILQMINYHMGWTDQPSLRGKRIRPLLTLLCFAGLKPNWEAALPVASAIEWVHNFSLVHDDVEDKSDTRRGRPTLWKQWGPAKAINVGDTIFTIGRLAIYRLIENGIPHAIALEAQHILDRGCLQLTQGQHLDLTLETQKDISIDTYLQMIEWKTSALISAATTIGACIAEASSSTIESYRAFGHNLGLAFQILDDILGIWGDPDLTGKPTGDDLYARKKTLPIIYGLVQSKVFADLFSRESEEVKLEDFINALEEVDALKQTRTTAQHYIDKSLAALEKAAPLDPASESLKQLTLRLLQRPS
jgi:geranylgeranyl diphosphate synthase type I